MTAKNKKADLSINIIIIAAIALIVLVVLIMIFTGRLNIFSTGVGKTEKSAYACICADPTDSSGSYVCTPNKPSTALEQIAKQPTTGCNDQFTDCVKPLQCWKVPIKIQ